MGLSVSHSLSATTPNDPLFEIQPKHWNSGHIYTLNAVGSEISNAFGNGGGVTFGLSADGNITASAPAAAALVNFSAGTASNNLGSVIFADSNGLAFGLGTGGSSRSITGSYTQSTHSHRTEFVAMTLGGNTAGTTTYHASNTDTLFFNGGNNITLSGNAGTVTIVGPTVTNSSWTVSDTATSATVGRLAFTAANGITMTLSTSNNGNHTVFASYTVPTVTNSSWTVSDAATSGTVARLAFTNLNGLTLSLSSGAGGSHTIVGSYTQSTHSHRTEFQAITLGGNTAGTTTYAASNTDTIFLNGGNNITLSGNAGTITISAANQTVQTQPISLFATSNTTNSTSATAAANSLLFQGAGGVSVGATNGSVQISAPATSSLVGASGLSVSTAGSTISVYPKVLSIWEPVPIMTGTGTSSHAPASFWFSKMILDWPVAVSYVNVLKSLNVSAPGASSQNSSLTNKFSYSHGLTLFTRQDFAGNSSNMSQWTTASFGMTGTLSQSSSSASVALSYVTNSTGGTTSFSTSSASNNWTNFFTGLQMFRIPLVTTLTPGEYFIGQAQSSTTATVGSNFTLLSVSNFHIIPQSITIATVSSSGSLAVSSPEGQGIGIASAVTTNNTMALSVISAGTQNWWYMNFSNV